MGCKFVERPADFALQFVVVLLAGFVASELEQLAEFAAVVELAPQLLVFAKVELALLHFAEPVASVLQSSPFE